MAKKKRRTKNERGGLTTLAFANHGSKDAKTTPLAARAGDGRRRQSDLAARKRDAQLQTAKKRHPLQNSQNPAPSAPRPPPLKTRGHLLTVDMMRNKEAY